MKIKLLHILLFLAITGSLTFLMTAIPSLILTENQKKQILNNNFFCCLWLGLCYYTIISVIGIFLIWGGIKFYLWIKLFLSNKF